MDFLNKHWICNVITINKLPWLELVKLPVRIPWGRSFWPCCDLKTASEAIKLPLKDSKVPSAAFQAIAMRSDFWPCWVPENDISRQKNICTATCLLLIQKSTSWPSVNANVGWPDQTKHLYNSSNQSSCLCLCCRCSADPYPTSRQLAARHEPLHESKGTSPSLLSMHIL